MVTLESQRKALREKVTSAATKSGTKEGWGEQAIAEAKGTIVPRVDKLQPGAGQWGLFIRDSGGFLQLVDTIKYLNPQS